MVLKFSDIPALSLGRLYGARCVCRISAASARAAHQIVIRTTSLASPISRLSLARGCVPKRDLDAWPSRSSRQEQVRRIRERFRV